MNENQPTTPACIKEGNQPAAMRTHHMRLQQIHDHLHSVMDIEQKGNHYLGPFYDMPAAVAENYNSRQLANLRPIVSMHDWIWDTCGVGVGMDMGRYKYTNRLCNNRDNPLFYYQSELLVDEMCSDEDMYYPAVTQLESDDHENEPPGPFFEMEEWTPSNDDFWQRWVKQELRANMDSSMLFRGLTKRSSGDLVKWTSNSDGANTFAQNLIWFKRHCEDGQRLPGDSFHIAYISTHEHRTVRSVVYAVGVFVQLRGFYSTMGITKSFRVTMSDTHEAEGWMKDADDTVYAEPERPVMSPVDWIKKYNDIGSKKGYAVKLQQFIRDRVLGFRTVGLLFRPNGIMHSIMKATFERVLVGSDLDWIHAKQLCEQGAKSNTHLMDCPAMIKQTHIEVLIEAEPKLAIPTPFWEFKTPFAHPDSALNPHLPLMFIRINHLHTKEEINAGGTQDNGSEEDSDWRDIKRIKLNA
jgi:hypothetical protein